MSKIEIIGAGVENFIQFLKSNLLLQYKDYILIILISSFYHCFTTRLLILPLTSNLRKWGIFPALYRKKYKVIKNLNCIILFFQVSKHIKLNHYHQQLTNNQKIKPMSLGLHDLLKGKKYILCKSGEWSVLTLGSLCCVRDTACCWYILNKYQTWRIRRLIKSEFLCRKITSWNVNDL